MSISKDFEKMVIPTYEPGKPEELPLFFEKRANQGACSKMYPIPYTDKIGDEKKDVVYDVGVLENKYVKIVTLPAIGGKIYSALDKTNNYDFIYRNKVIKPCMIGIAGPWASGGIEFNWPLHHRPTTFMPMDAVIETDENGNKTVWMGEVEPYNRLKGMVGVSIDKDRSYVRAKARLYNPTSKARPFLWWANLAVEIDDNFRTVFPPDVEYVNDHDRRAMIEWPVAKGRFETARPYDYGTGVDIHVHKNIIVPSSFMIAKGQSDYDYLSGWDNGRKCGIVAFGNHHTAPGKKLWTWANNNFGYKWCENLTDDGSRYVELMTGCYTDNQPDFSFIAPYETREFEQYWYPIKEIGEVKCATLDAAVNLENEEGKIKVGFCASGEFTNCKVVIAENGKTVKTFENVTVSPETPFVAYTDGEVKIGTSATLYSAEGKVLVSYCVSKRGDKKPPKMREVSPRPKDIKTNEELYLHGAHLVQYKHFTYNPEEYFAEALKRDDGDSRCNIAMGDLYLERGKFEKALGYFEKAEERLELRNANPYDTDALYKRGLAKRYLGDKKGAYDDFYWAAWGYSNRSAAYYAIAAYDYADGKVKDAIDDLKVSLETNQGHLWALRMLNEITGDKKYLDEIVSADPLFMEFDTHEGQAIDFANELIRFGMLKRAKEVLSAADVTPKTLYYLAYVSSLLGEKDEAAKYVKQADKAEWRYCNFNRLEDIAVLKSAGSARAMYYLGCLYYDRDNYDEAATAWEAGVKGEDFAPSYRGLAIAYFDHLNRKDEALAMMNKAYKLMPESGRIFYELSQLYKGLNKSVDERLALYENDMKNTFGRDDTTLDYTILLVDKDRLDDAAKILEEHRFHTYEGGEGNLTNYHAWLHVLLGDREYKKGNYEKAYKLYETGLTFPKNYGEEKNVYVNDGHLYGGMARCLDKLGKDSAAYWEKACYTLGTPSINSYYNVLAFRKRNMPKEAEKVIEGMKNAYDSIMADVDRYPYFGVGAPAFMPFMYDCVKFNTTKALQIKGFTLLAEGKKNEVGKVLDELKNLNCGDINTILLEKVLNEGNLD